MTDFPVVEVRDYESLVEAFIALKAHLGLSNQTCDDLAGFAAGTTDKFLGPGGVKKIGPVTFSLLCGLFAVKFIPVLDVEAAERMAGRWERRNSAQVRATTTRVSKTLLDRALRHLAREFSWAEILAAIGQARATVAAEAKAERKVAADLAARNTNRPAPVTAAFDRPLPDELEAIAENASIAVGAGRDRRSSKPGSLRYGGQQTARTRLKAMQSSYLTRAKAAAAAQI